MKLKNIDSWVTTDVWIHELSTGRDAKVGERLAVVLMPAVWDSTNNRFVLLSDIKIDVVAEYDYDDEQDSYKLIGKYEDVTFNDYQLQSAELMPYDLIIRKFRSPVVLESTLSINPPPFKVGETVAIEKGRRQFKILTIEEVIENKSYYSSLYGKGKINRFNISF